MNRAMSSEHRSRGKPRRLPALCAGLAACLISGSTLTTARAEPKPAEPKPAEQKPADSKATPPAASKPTPKPAAPAPTSRPAGLSTDGTSSLEVPGFLPALVSFPESGHWPQPTLVAAHGAGDSPELHCELWRSLIGPRGVIVCPRGQPMRKGADGYFYPTHLALEREVLATLKALRERYPRHADTEPATYAGYSQGANMGALMLVEHGKELPRILLLEGGSGDMNAVRSKRFQKTGGQAVAIVCGRPKCSSQAQRASLGLRRLGLQGDAYYVEGAGHSNFQMMLPTLREAFERLIESDPRWGR
jgi:predicted esterase